MSKWESTGSFWRSDSPKGIYWGTIAFVPGIGTKIELNGKIVGRGLTPHPSEIPVIHGQLFNGALITCFTCWCVVETFLTNKRNARSHITSQLSVSGGHWMNSAEFKPDYLQLKLSHLNEWFENPYNISYESEDLNKCLLTFNENPLIADFEFKEEKVSLRSFCAHSLPFEITPDGKSWPYSHHLVIRPASKKGLDWLLDVASSIRDIFVFLIGSGVYTLDLVGLTDSDESSQARIFHVNCPVTIPRAIRYESKYFLTCHSDYRENIPMLIKAWFEHLDDLNVVIETYRELLCSDGASHTTILFRAVQTLEHLYGLLWPDDSRYVNKATFKRFVRWVREQFPLEIQDVPLVEINKLEINKEIILARLGGLNDISLRSKLERLFKEIPPSILSSILGNPQELDEHLSNFLKRLEASRHFLTHFNLKQKPLAFSEDEIQDAALVCWAVLTYWMSRKLGIDCTLAGKIALKAKSAMFLVNPRLNL